MKNGVTDICWVTSAVRRSIQRSLEQTELNNAVAIHQNIWHAEGAVGNMESIMDILHAVNNLTWSLVAI